MTDDMSNDLVKRLRDLNDHMKTFILDEAADRIELLEKHMQLIINRTKYRGGSFDDYMPDVVFAIARDALGGKER